MTPRPSTGMDESSYSDRREDPALLTGAATFTGDIERSDLAHLTFLRSQYAHATIDGIETTPAASRPEVHAVYTAADLDAADIQTTLPTDDVPFATVPDQPLLAGDRVRYQGEPIAAVVADDRYAAHDAAAAISVSYDSHAAVTDPLKTTESEAPTVHEAVDDNVAFEWELGDATAVSSAVASAEHAVTVELKNNRVLPSPLEPRAVVATPPGSSEKLEVALSCQNPHIVQDRLATVLNQPAARIRVTVPAVGGGFGAKLQPYAGHLLTAWAALQHDQPVKWQGTRTAECTGSIHARDHRTEAELGLDADGTIRGLRVETTANLGAYLSYHAAAIATGGYGRMLPGQYVIPAFHLGVTGVFTNTTPMSAYRGAGRPEACFVIERLLHDAARELDVDPLALRRHNFIPPEDFPYETVTGHEYDSGDYAGALEEAKALIEYDAVRERQAALRAEDRYLGIGVSCYVDAVGGAPSDVESALVRCTEDGRVEVYTGAVENGQGHLTTYASITAGILGIPAADIEVIDGDTDTVPPGHGTGGSRAVPIGGSAIVDAAHDVIRKGRRIAAHELEASVEDIEFTDGTFAVTGASHRSLTLAEVATAAAAGRVPGDLEASLEATAFYDPSTYTFPFGTHAAVVEVDPATGNIDLLAYAAVTDVGNQIHPELVDGQVHGGVVQGIGQALFEEAVYDEAGNLQTASFQDYALPKALDVPGISTASTVTPCPHNPLGAKGVGESGAIAAPPAVVNAVRDALAPLGVDGLEMPLTAERVWRATN